MIHQAPHSPFPTGAASLAVLAAVAALVSSCTWRGPALKPSPWPTDVAAALDEAGANRGQLERVLIRYQAAGDTLKLQAAAYLIANMADHCFVRLSLVDSLKREVPLDVLRYPNYEALQAVVDSIEDARGELDYERRATLPDLETMTAKLLAENIDYAFRAWRERPWAQHMSFDDFLEYVLPYRGSNEPLESWRPYFYDRYSDLPLAMQDPTDPIEAARLINADLMTWFTFDARFYLHPTDQGLAEMRAGGLGRCEDMTNLAIYAMRANGLAVTSDYTPFWANAGNNHAWNAILDRDGRVLSFMGCEAQPGQYKLWNRLAKAYRKTYAQQRGNLAFLKGEHERVPAWLSGKYYRDVTADYVTVADVPLELEEPAPDSVGFAYLCVFNSGHWEAIDWGRLERQGATFRDMGTGIAYLPAYYAEGEILPAGPAFVLEESGRVRPLEADMDRPQKMRLISSMGAVTVSDTDGVRKTALEPGRSYELFYWDGAWVSMGQITAGDEPIAFEGVPSGGLYWLVAEGSRRDERIFTYEQNAQVWW
jgi:hypothetical protein